MKTKSNNNQNSGLKSRTALASNQQTKMPRIDLKRRFINRGLPTSKVLDLLFHKTPRLYQLAEVVGKWVWVEFTEKQPTTVTSELAQIGFHWNRRRNVWQHPCGQFSTGSSNDPRQKYRTYHPADAKAA